MYYKTTNFLVAGLQKSGVSATKFLLEKGASVYIYDKRKTEQIQKNIEALEFLGAKIVDDYKKAVEYIDVLVISPGVPIDSDIAITYKKEGKRIIGELELGYTAITTPIIAVTGTNGKTTVCSMIHKSLEKSGIKSILAGNVGTPITSTVNEVNASELCVLEVSSFQLETTYSFTPHVSILLNLTPDHLDRHYSMENYSLVKSKILLPLKESEFAVLNYDDERVKQFSNITKAKVIWFSTREVVDGCYIDGDNVVYKGEEIIKIKDLSLKEPHNLENVLATVCALKVVGVKNEEIKKSLSNFKGVKHRFETVCTVNGVTFINDSKSTNPDSTVKAINSLDKNAVLIMGGSEKGLDYTSVFESIKNSKSVKNVVITGSNSNSMMFYASKANLDGVIAVKGFDNAIKTAYKLANKNEIVLLSPGTASFDEFNSFEERGERFVKIAKSLEE